MPSSSNSGPPAKSSPRERDSSSAPPRRRPPKTAQRPALRVQTIENQDDGDANLGHRLKRHFHSVGSTLTSFLIHAIILIILAFLVYSKPPTPGLKVVAEFTSEPEIVRDRLEPQDMAVEITTPEPDHAVVERAATDTSLAEELPTPTISTSDEREAAPNEAVVENPLTNQPEPNTPLGGGLEGRTSSSRASLAAQFGGTARSELAVENGLKWLAMHQREDGSWWFNFNKESCNERCRHPGTQESTTAATGLSLMAFLGAGYTHQSGPYKKQVRAGIQYLVGRMRKTYFGGNLAEGSMYAQGIATIALCEAYAMTGDTKLESVIRAALDYIITAQHSKGGWRYLPGQPGDTTVTGWQVMALKSGQLAGFDIPDKTMQGAKDFLATVGSDSEGVFGYQGNTPTPTTTAVGLLLQIYLGWGREHRGLVHGANYLSKVGPSENNIYFNYYATQVLFHSRHSGWDTWNQQLREYLVQTQSVEGHESGSWHFQDKHGNVGGRLYTTAMSIMILEVYYRYLPLFDREVVGVRR